VFTHAIVEGLRGGADPSEGEWITAEGIFNFAKRQVGLESPPMRPQHWVAKGNAPLRVAQNRLKSQLRSSLDERLCSADYSVASKAFFQLKEMLERKDAVLAGRAARMMRNATSERAVVSVPDKMLYSIYRMIMSALAAYDAEDTRVATFVSHTPNPHGWPKETDLVAFYGPPGRLNNAPTPPPPLTKVPCPWKLKIAWDLEKSRKFFWVHVKVADSLAEILEKVHAHYGEVEIDRLGLNLFGGDYNDAPATLALSRACGCSNCRGSHG
jgi:hypothetical protein